MSSLDLVFAINEHQFHEGCKIAKYKSGLFLSTVILKILPYRLPGALDDCITVSQENLPQEPKK